MRLPLVLSLLLLWLAAACSFPFASVQAPTGPRGYVAIGASDSVGVGADDPEREGWVTVLHSRLPAGSRLANLAVSGSTLEQALEQQLPVALAAQPDLVTVWLAVNDFNAGVPLETYTAQLDRLIRELGVTRATVLVGNMPDVSSLAPFRSRDPAAIRAAVAAWNVEIAAIAERHGAELVDVHAVWHDLGRRPELVAADGFHPSTAGHRALAELFEQALALAELKTASVRKTGFIFQSYHLLPILTARENVELPLLLVGRSQRQARERALELLAAVGLTDRAEHLPSQLSGGQQQRVAVARALANEPEVVWADEPTGNLDSEMAEEVLQLLERLNRERGQTLVVVTHAENVAARADRVLTMRDGAIVADTRKTAA